MPLLIKNDPNLTHETVKSLLSYGPETGIFRWREREWPAHTKSGKEAGGLDAAGYANIKLLGRTYKAHRLAWFYVHGSWPEGEIDHINCVRSDNRISNLRDVSRAENMLELGLFKNNKTGIRGVFYDKSRNRYRARVAKDGKQRYLGMYRTADEARLRYAAETAPSD